ncbi:hypothetical protein [Vibrio splendidus]|uniref:hypothetical protein n=1 Tax=Vibrio splendidus TaxID=29497 RepID=UPI00035FD017|nr:hypothetical protein [Vibrio splendidus]OEE52397.1 hypothetical protein A146_23535 [Vibrio splendidus FF-500]
MSKFRKGETSKLVIEKKNSITKSIKRKAEIIDKIKCYEDIPSSLIMKKNTISLMSVHNWVDSNLDLIRYSYNSARAEHNEKNLESLIESIDNANARLVSNLKPEINNNCAVTTRLPQGYVKKLKSENEELRVALAEVYRAYMQILGEYREDKQIDAAYRKLILAQAKILGKNRVWEIK